MRVEPFAALRYDTRRSGSWEELVAPPYDQLTEELREQLLQLCPYNVVHLTLGPDQAGDGAHENRYLRAQKLLQQWRERGVLARDAAPALYPYQIGRPGAPALWGLLGMGELADYEEGKVLPHESTLEGPKQDRLELLRATATDLEPIVVLFSDPAGAARNLLAQSGAATLAELTTPDGWHHRLHRLDDRDLQRTLQELLQDQSVVIADGHHRYEVALEYRDERAEAESAGAAGFKMMLLVAANDPGLEVLPIHRLLRRLPVPPPLLKARLESYFDLRPVGAAEKLAGELSQASPTPRFGLALDGELLRLDLKPGMEAALPWPAETGPTERRVEVALFTQLVLGHLLGIGESELATGSMVEYTHSWTEAVESVRAARHAAAFFLRPLPAATFWQAVREGVVLPRKSTHFRPKPLSGLAFAELR
jgi:uncharacterized protein (DUF1015 family)